MGDHNHSGRDPSDETHRADDLDSEATEADEASQSRPEPIEATLADQSDLSRQTEVDVAGFDTAASPADPVGATLELGAAPGRSRRALPTVAGYEIRGELGRGAMGVVYLARQLRLDRACALKMILAGAHADAIAARRFLVEAQAVARLGHPNVVQIYHIGESDGLPFFEMEYLDGGSLDQRLDGTPWPPRRAAKLVEDLTRGMAEAHRLDIVHRDLKPANVLLAADGTPKITDFGLARALNADSRLTRTESILGSPSYMAPEQAEGHTHDAGPPADIYSLGAMLYELLTGRPPFKGATVLETLEQVKAAEAVPLSRLVPGVPRQLETIALKCLQKEPGKRYASAEALAEDLRRFQAGEPVLGRRTGPIERAWRWSRRNPAVASLLASLLVVFVAGFALVAAAWVQAERARTLAVERGSEALKSLVEANVQHRRADEKAESLRREDYVSRVDLAYRECLDDNIARARELLAGCPEDLRGWEWSFVQRQCHLDLHTFQESASSVNCVAFSPDGTRMVLGTGPSFVTQEAESGDLVVRDVASGRVLLAQRKLPGGVNAVAFSPDGHWLAFGHGSDLVVCDADNGQERFRRSGGPDSILSLAFSPDSRRIIAGYGHINQRDAGYATLWDATTGDALVERIPGQSYGVWSVAFGPDGRHVALTGEGRIDIWDVETRTPIRTLRGHGGLIYTVAFSPDGRFIASGGLDRAVRLWDRATGQQVRAYQGHKGFVRGLAFSRDSQRIASVSEDKSLKLWSVGSDRELVTFHGHENYVNCVAFSPDGWQVASGSLDRTAKLWFTAPSARLTYRGHEGWVDGAAFGPDGRSIVTGSCHYAMGNGLQFWDAVTGELLGTFPGRMVRVLALALSSDGKRLASAFGASRSIQVWEMATKREIHVLQGHTSEVESLAFSPDGTRLASVGWDNTVKIWDVSAGRELFTLRASAEPVRAVAFSADGTRVASGGGVPMRPDAVRVWDAATGRLIHALKGHTGPVLCVAFSPDGSQLVSAGGTLGRFAEVKVWDTSTGREIHNITGHTDQVRSVAFSPDGRRLATGSNDRTIKLWDTSVYRDVFTLRWHTAGVNNVAFSPDGTRLVSGSIDRTAEIWDLNARAPGDLYRREAVALVRRLFDDLRDKSCVVEAIRADTALGGPMRRHALEIAERAEDGPSAVLVRAESHARRGDWARAAAAFGTAIEQEPYDLELRRLHMLSLLEAGDDAGYRLAAVDLLKRLGGSTDAGVMNHVAWPCLIAPDADPSDRAPVRLAEDALLRYPGMQREASSTTSVSTQGVAPKLSHDWGRGREVFLSLQKRFDLTVLGAALYRIGNLDEATRLIEQGIENRGGKSTPKDWAFLAMAYHRKRNTERARLWLGKLRARQPDTAHEQFWDEVEIQLLRREVEALLLDSALPSDPFAH